MRNCEGALTLSVGLGRVELHMCWFSVGSFGYSMFGGSCMCASG